MTDVLFHFPLIILLSTIYDFILISSIACFINGVLDLPLPGLPSSYPSTIVVIQGLFLIKYPIYTLPLSL